MDETNNTRVTGESTNSNFSKVLPTFPTFLGNITPSMKNTSFQILLNLPTTFASTEPTEAVVQKKELLMEWFDYFLVVSFVLILIIGVFGNSLVCYFFKTSYKELKGMALLLFYLSCVDLFASIVNPILFLYWQLTFHKKWHFGMVGCKIIPTVAKCLVTASLGIIWLITIERSIVISRPYTVRLKNKHIKMAFLVVLLFSVLCETPWIIHNNVLAKSTCIVPDLRVDSFFYPAVIILIVRDFIFLATFLGTTIVIYRVLYDKSSLKTLKEQKTLEKNKKIMKLLLLLAIVFILLVFPREILHVAYMISWKSGQGIAHTHTLRNINSFLKILHMCNSVANIFIYAGLLGRFRHKLKRFISTMLGRRFASETLSTAIDNESPFSESGMNYSLAEQSSFTYSGK